MSTVRRCAVDGPPASTPKGGAFTAELETPEPLASAFQGLVGAQSPLGLQLGGQGGGSGPRVVSCDHFDGHTLTLLYRLVGTTEAGER